MKNKNIRWAAIQPLTGGMYLGAEEAIGHPAEFILSYKGLDNVKYDKSGENIIDAGNEYNLVNYLEEKNRCPKYYKMDKGMFDDDFDNMKPDIYLGYVGDTLETPSYENLDLVVAVPVCSGLSMVTSGTPETKETRNCNMLWITKYTLSVIKPKIYIFENAPTFMSNKGKDLRQQFEKMAMDLGYSILYYKTDTKYHHNCQHRPRTFVIFFKHNGEGIQNPFLFDYEDVQIPAVEYFSKIDNNNLTQNEPIKSAPHNYIVLDFINKKLNNDLSTINGWLMVYILKHNLLDELIEFTKNYDCDDTVKNKSLTYFERIKYKLSQGLNYFADDIGIFKEYFPSIQFKTISNLMHPTENRTCSCREILSLMGMPEDFTFYGNSLSKIGQNVPVKTAKFIVEQAIKHLNSWEDERLTDTNVIYQDNNKKKIIEKY